MTRRVENLPGEEKQQRELAALLRRLPQQEAPRNFTAAVLARLEPQPPRSLWRRWCRWLRTPRVITIRPLSAVSMTAAILLILVAGYVPRMVPQPPAARQASGTLVPVVLDLACPNAASVAVIGSFNGWKPEGYEMQTRTGTGHWIIELKIPAGAYEYAFLVDGHQVVVDPGAMFYKSDGFGSRNAVIYAGSNGQNTV